MAKTWIPRRRRKRQQPIEAVDLWRRLRVATTLLGFVLLAGTLGYVVLGLGPVDAIYQTVITVSTVGYREVGAVDTAYKIFTMMLILFGAGSVLYTFGVLLETLVEGRLTKEFGRRRMEQAIDNLSNHTIVCGWGQVGRAISATLAAEGRDVVVIDRDIDTTVQHHLLVIGDATEDHVLREAGLQRAASLVVALNNAADNVYVTLSARSAKPELFIVARANSPDAEPKLYQAGADRVVNPHQLGGAHMAALVAQPNVAEFLDIAMHDRELSVRISEVMVPDGSVLAGRPLGECDLCGTTVLAVRERSGRFVHHPDPTTTPNAGDVLIALGTADEHAELRRRAASPLG